MGNILHTSNFVTRLKELRTRAKNWTQQTLANEMGVDLKTVRNWENDKLDPPACEGMKVVNFIKLCEIMGCDPEYLIGDLPTQRKVNADIVAETGISDKAVYTLRNMTENERLFLNKLLEDRGSFYFIAEGFADFNSKRVLNSAIDNGIVEDDLSPATLEIKKEIDYCRFTLQNRFMRFLDSSTK